MFVFVCYNTRLLTPRDWGSHFKNVLHRALMVRSITTGEPCRCCKFDREDLRHFGNCQVASTIFDNFHSLTDEEDLTGNDRDRFCLFALLPKGALGEGLIALLVRRGRPYSVGGSALHLPAVEADVEGGSECICQWSEWRCCRGEACTCKG